MEHNVGGKTAADVFENLALRQLAQAACRGDASAVDSAVRAGTNPNDVGLDGTTVLVWAVSCDSTAGVQALLAAGANPDLPIGNRFSSVVYVAANRDEPGPLQALLEAGADANVYDLKSERTGIGEALLRGIHKADWRHWELLLNKVDINRPYNKFGKTIAVYAANFNQFERVLQLLERGYRYRLSELGRAIEVAENLTEPFATWQHRAVEMLKARGVVFPVGPTKVQLISEAELQRLPATRR